MTVEEKVREITMKITRKTDIEFKEGTTFSDFEADSLDIVQILTALEDEYDIEVVDEEMQELTNIKEFVAYIEKKVAEKNG